MFKSEMPFFVGDVEISDVLKWSLLSGSRVLVSAQFFASMDFVISRKKTNAKVGYYVRGFCENECIFIKFI